MRRLEPDRTGEPAGARSGAHGDAEARRRAARAADRSATIIGLLLLAPVVLWFAWQGAWIGAKVGLCHSSACRTSAIDTGMAVAVYGPLIAWVLAHAASILRLALRRTAWWIPPVALVVAIVAQQVGGSIADGW